MSVAKRVQFRGGTTTAHQSFTGANKEITVDTDKKTLVVHDGLTPGGIPLAKEVDLDNHINDSLNPHGVTKVQVGLGNVDNTADSNKSVLRATKLATARTIALSGGVSGSTSFDGSGNVTLSAQVIDNSHNHTSLSGTVSFSGSTGNAYNNSNIMVNGNANTIKPSIGFHQPGLYAGTLSMENGTTFQFKDLNATPAILANSITGNAETATKLSTTQDNYKDITDSVVVGQLMWKNYGNNHTIFDASNSTTPTGVTKNNTNPDNPWSPTFPTLMGYNGSQTCGVRVDSSRFADRLKTARTINGVAFDGSANITIVDSTKLPLSGGTMTGAITAIRETKVAMAANDINLAQGNLFTKTISGATTLTISNALADGTVNSFVLELTNGGSAVITWFSGVKWAGGTAPTLTASGKDILGFYSHDGGTTWNILGVNKDVK